MEEAGDRTDPHERWTFTRQTFKWSWRMRRQKAPLPVRQAPERAAGSRVLDGRWTQSPGPPPHWTAGSRPDPGQGHLSSKPPQQSQAIPSAHWPPAPHFLACLPTSGFLEVGPWLTRLRPRFLSQAPGLCRWLNGPSSSGAPSVEPRG